MSVGFWLKTAAAFVFRSGRTTAALGAVICIAVAALVFLSAVATGVNDGMIKNSTGLYTGQISGEGLPASLTPEALALSGVATVLRRYPIPGTVTKVETRPSGGGETRLASVDLRLVLTAFNPEAEKETCFLWKKIVSGAWPVSGENGILISGQAAMALEAGPGDSLVFRSGTMSVKLAVAGVFDTRIAAMDMAFCPRSALPSLPETWSAAVFLRPGVSETAIRSAWGAAGIDPARFRTWQESMPDLTQLIELNRISMGFVMILVLGVVAFATASAFAISIISRLREYGIMKSMGVTAKETVLLIFSQVLLLNLLAAAGGVLMGAAAVFLTARTGIDLTGFTSHNQYFAVSGVIIPRLTPFSLLLPPGLSMAFCLAAAVWPVLIVVRQHPARILRSI